MDTIVEVPTAFKAAPLRCASLFDLAERALRAANRRLVGAVERVHGRPELWHRRCGAKQISPMVNAAAQTVMSYEAYLALERATDQKHEWLDGQVYAMAGGTPPHAALSARMLIELGRLLGDRPCVPYSSDLKIRVPKTKLATYADAAVVCGEPSRDDEDRNAVTNPIVLAEVLSDSTERWDRNGKFRHYRKLASLRDYVLVSQHERFIEVYSRDAEGRWVLSEAGEGESVLVSSLEARIEVDRVYRGIALDPDQSSARPHRADR